MSTLIFKMKGMQRILPLVVCIACAALAAKLDARQDSIITVQVSGMRSQQGVVRCALFAGPEGFPMRSAAARSVVSKKIAGRRVQCVFPGLAAGTYAVSVNHDENENGTVDANLLGIPTEGWAVSNNAQPALRPPRFAEAAIMLKAGQRVEQSLRLVN